jgi:ribosomal protein S27AE
MSEYTSRSGSEDKMTDVIRYCSRCGNSLSDGAFTLSLEKDLPESVPQDLQLCPRCAESFQRWFRKRGNLYSKAALNRQADGSSALPPASSSNHSKRRRHRDNQRHRLIRILLVISLTVLLFLLTFYGTWRILSTATRVEE